MDAQQGDATATHPALRRVLAGPHGDELLRTLADDLSGADLTTLLLEVFRRRASANTPVDVLRQYRRDRFVRPAPTSARLLRAAESMVLAAVSPDYEEVVLAPVAPLGTHSSVATVDPRNVLATVRSTEVAADPTNALALEAAVRRAAAVRAGDRGRVVRLAASQRVLRAQVFSHPEALAHFHLVGLVTAGPDTGDHRFEATALAEQLTAVTRSITTVGLGAHARITVLEPAAARLLHAAQEALAPLPGVVVDEDRERASGRGYYTGLCFKVHAVTPTREIELADGGFVDWTQRLTGNAKERLLIGGVGLDRLVMAMMEL